MKILLISATHLEIAPFLARVGVKEHKQTPVGATIPIPTKSDQLVLTGLVTGVGPALSAFHLGRFLRKGDWDLLLQVGIAGAFSSTLKKCQVVRVESEVFADLGAEDNGSYLDLFDMGLLYPDQFPFSAGRLRVESSSLGEYVNYKQVEHLPSVSAATVNRVLSQPDSISWISNKYSPDIVSMEGASFFYAALLNEIPAIQMRSISDYVGPRDKSSWDIHGAIAALNENLYSFLHPMLPEVNYNNNL